MVTLDHAIAVFEQLLIDVPAKAAELTEVAALSGLRLLDVRIHRQGTGSSSAPLAPYTPQYLKRKTKKGRYRGVVDLMDTGQMWNSIGLIEKTEAGGGTTVIIGGRDEHTKQVMAGLNNKRPGWLSNSEEERRIIGDDADKGMGEFIISRLQ